ncbi:MAG: Lrp/AsnC family transcriptional regulator [Thermoplasmata archaeon]|nr:Lrp/AsnC family transcriptional regulator [Thermoplasmata archaeon]
MDDLDRSILERLREDSRITNAKLGASLGLTEGAIRHRLLRLQKDQVILRYTVITRPLGPGGLVLIRCRPGATEEVVAQLRSRARDLFETSGEYDLAVSLDRATMEEFNAELDRIRSLPGVQSTLTLIRLTRFVGPGGAPPAPGASSTGIEPTTAPRAHTMAAATGPRGKGGRAPVSSRRRVRSRAA